MNRSIKFVMVSGVSAAMALVAATTGCGPKTPLRPVQATVASQGAETPLPAEVQAMADRISRFTSGASEEPLNVRSKLTDYLNDLYLVLDRMSDQASDGEDPRENAPYNLYGMMTDSGGPTELRFAKSVLNSPTVRPIALNWLKTVLVATAAHLKPEQKALLMTVAKGSNRYLTAISDAATFQREQDRLIRDDEYETPEEFATEMAGRAWQKFWFRRVYFDKAPAAELAQFVGAIEAALR